MKISDPRKEVLACLLKSKTPMRNTWITDRLRLGHASRILLLFRAVQSAEDGGREELKQSVNSMCEY